MCFWHSIVWCGLPLGVHLHISLPLCTAAFCLGCGFDRLLVLEYGAWGLPICPPVPHFILSLLAVVTFPCSIAFYFPPAMWVGVVQGWGFLVCATTLCSFVATSSYWCFPVPLHLPAVAVPFVPDTLCWQGHAPVLSHFCGVCVFSFFWDFLLPRCKTTIARSLHPIPCIGASRLRGPFFFQCGRCCQPPPRMHRGNCRSIDLFCSSRYMSCISTILPWHLRLQLNLRTFVSFVVFGCLPVPPLCFPTPWRRRSIAFYATFRFGVKSCWFA